MKVQTKILLLLLGIVGIFVGGLVALKVFERTKFKAIAERRQAERNRIFDEFILERGDRLKVLMEDSTNWDDLVRAVVRNDTKWAEENLGDGTLATYQANAVWVYRPDGTLFYSNNNRYADNLRELPLPKNALAQLPAERRVLHFFLKVPQGWLEMRGGTIHPSRDRFRETSPQGWLFVGQIWIDENIRRMSMFTGYSIRIESSGEKPPTPGHEEYGLISFTRDLPGWDGKPTAHILVEADSPLIRELNRASERLFSYLIAFAAFVSVLVSTALLFWVRRPLKLISHHLESENTDALVPLSKKRSEFGKLARLILEHRRTEEALHQAEEQLRHSQKLEAVGRLAGGVAHDFNNLLTAIIGYSEMLEARLRSDKLACEYAQLVRKAGERAAELTRQLLAFSRKQLLQPKVLDIGELLREMEKLLQRVIGEHIRIHIDATASETRVLADPSQLEQVILNLGVNARDAMPGGGSLTLRAGVISISEDAPQSDLPPGEYVELAVQDTGSGMDAETKARIFEPFFTTKGPGKGTGLGLATVYGIVKQSSGGIAVESTPEVGSTFRVFLPREHSPVDPTPAELPPVTPSEEHETILVVEDEEVVRLLVCNVLEDAGYDVLCAGSPSEALSVLQQHRAPIDLLVSDVVMPEMNGPALARALTAMQPSMKVLFVSGYSDSDISDQGVVDSSLEFLHKPFTQQSLIRKVRSMLDAETAEPQATA